MHECPQTPVYFLELVLFTFDRKTLRTIFFSKNTIYMFCLYHFSVECIIDKNYLPPYGSLMEMNFSKLTDTNQILRNDFVCIHYHLCKISVQIIE